MDKTDLKNIQSQINTLKQQFNATQTQLNNQIISITSVVYSGNNRSSSGELLPNPILIASQKELASGELVMQYSSANGWWQSLTYQNEFVLMDKGNIVRRIDVAKNIYVDFDYRAYARPTLDITYNLKESEIKLDTELRQKTFTEAKEALDSKLPQKGELETGMTQEQRDAVQEKYLQDTRDLTLSYRDIYFTQDRVAARRKQTVGDKTGGNIFQNEECQNIYMEGCTNIYFEQPAVYKNITLINSSNVFMQGCQDSDFENVTNAAIYDGHNLHLKGLKYAYISKDCLQYGNLYQYEGDYLIVGQNSCNGADIKVRGNVIIGNRSCNYAVLHIAQPLTFTICVLQNNEGALNYAEAEIDAHKTAAITLTSGCSNYGKLTCPTGSFENGSLYYQNNQYYQSDYQQSISFEKNIRTFFMKKHFKNIEIIDPTKYIIQKDTYNGPFDEWYILQNMRLNKYLKLDSGDNQIFYGHACTDYQTQTFSSWGQIQGQAVNQSYMQIVSDGSTYQINIPEIPVFSTQVAFENYTVQKIVLVFGSTAYSHISDFTWNGKSLMSHFEQTDIEILFANTSQFSLSLAKATDEQLNVRSLKFSGTEPSSFDIDLGTGTKEQLTSFTITDNLIRKITPREKMFYNANNTAFNCLQFFTNLKYFSKHCFDGARVDFNSANSDSISLYCSSMQESACENTVFTSTNGRTINASTEIDLQGQNVFKNSTSGSVTFDQVTSTSQLGMIFNCKFTNRTNANIDYAFLYSTIIKEITLQDTALMRSKEAFRESAIQKCSANANFGTAYTQENVAMGIFRGCKRFVYYDTTNLPIIGKYQFYNCTALTTLGSGLSALPAYSCYGCTSLESITTSGVGSFGDYCLAGCINVTTVDTLQGSSFGTHCFEETKIGSFTISSIVNVADIGESLLFNNKAECEVLYQPDSYNLGFKNCGTKTTIKFSQNNAYSEFLNKVIAYPEAYAKVTGVQNTTE